jgi:hypothetical protein
MQVYYFTELPYHEYPDEEGAKYPSLRLTFPNTYYDPHKAHDLFHRYLDEYQYCEEMGFDGLMLNEHHNTPSCMNATMNLIGSILARNTRNAKILLLGNVLPIWDNPLRLRKRSPCSIFSQMAASSPALCVAPESKASPRTPIRPITASALRKRTT